MTEAQDDNEYNAGDDEETSKPSLLDDWFIFSRTEELSSCPSNILSSLPGYFLTKISVPAECGC